MSQSSCHSISRPGPEVIKLFYMFSSAEHEFFLLLNMKMPTFVGIFTLISIENLILCSAEQENNCTYQQFAVY